MQKRLITVNVFDGCQFSDCLHELIYSMCSECPPSARMHALSHTSHWSMDASVMHCSMLCQLFIFATERHDSATNKIW